MWTTSDVVVSVVPHTPTFWIGPPPTAWVTVPFTVPEAPPQNFTALCGRGIQVVTVWSNIRQMPSVPAAFSTPTVAVFIRSGKPWY